MPGMLRDILSGLFQYVRSACWNLLFPRWKTLQPYLLQESPDYVQKGILKFHDFRTAEFSDVKIRNVDVFDVFTEDELELFRQTIKVYNGNNFDIDYSTVPDEELDYPIDEYQTKDPIIISKSKVKDIYSFNWYFNGLEGIYLNRGVVVELTDGRLIVAHNCIEGYNGYYLRDKALELTGETKTKMQNVLLQVTEPEYEFDKYELAKEMVESVSN